MAGRLIPDASSASPVRQGSGTAAPILVLGRADDASLTQAATLGGVVHLAQITDLKADLLARLKPEWVIFPLMAASFDAAHVIEVLAHLGYSGRACVMSPRLPNRRMVEVELRSIYPTLILVLIETPD